MIVRLLNHVQSPVFLQQQGCWPHITLLRFQQEVGFMIG